MTQNDLNRAVARKTGETVSLIASLGFVPLTSPPREREPLTVDWDRADAARNVSLTPRRKQTPAAAKAQDWWIPDGGEIMPLKGVPDGPCETGIFLADVTTCGQIAAVFG